MDLLSFLRISCSRNETHVETRDLESLGHDFGAWIKAEVIPEASKCRPKQEKCVDNSSLRSV